MNTPSNRVIREYEKREEERLRRLKLRTFPEKKLLALIRRWKQRATHYEPYEGRVLIQWCAEDLEDLMK